MDNKAGTSPKKVCHTKLLQRYNKFLKLEKVKLNKLINHGTIFPICGVGTGKGSTQHGKILSREPWSTEAR